jgi:hypothetical protein
MGIPLVALMGQQPKIDDYQTMQARAAGIQNMRGQNALQPGQLQEQQQNIQQNQNQLEIQKRQLADQDAMTKAMQEWDPKDINSLPSLVQKHGGSAQAVISMKTGLVKLQQDTANLTEAQLKIEKIKTDHFAESLGNVLDLPPEQQAQAFEAAKADSVKQGFMDPQHAQQLQYQNPMQLASLRKVLMGHSAVMAETESQAKIAKEQQLAAESAAKVPGEVAKSTEAQQEAAMSPAERAQLKLLGEPAALEMKDWLAKNPGKGPADYAKWHASLAPQAQINVQGGAPSNDLAAAVANGNMKIGDVLTYRTPLPLRQQFLKQVLAINPSYKSYDFDIERGVAKDFTSGKSAQNLTAFNTAIDHASQLDKAVDALKNNDVRGLNAIGNKLGYEFGNDATTNFNVIKNALSGEVSKVFKGGQATDAEIHAVQAPFDSANSPQQLKGAIKTAINLMNSKKEALQQQYEAGRKAQPNFGGATHPSGHSTGDTRSYNGATYKFDGNQWVKQ